MFGNGGGLMSLNAVTGALQWRYSDGNTLDVDSSPAVTGPPGARVVSFTTQTGAFEVVSLATGALLYQYQTANYMVTSPADANGSLIATSGDGYLYDFAPGGGNGPPPTTTVTSPADRAALPYPGASVALSGSAADAGGAVASVRVAVQRDGASGQWWDAASGTWVAAPYPNPATLSAPGTAATSWSLSLPTTAQGAGYQVLASVVNTSGVADVSAEQSAGTPARINFSVEPSPPPDITLSTPTAALLQKLTVSGSGFADGGQVTLSLAGATLAVAKANASGVLPATPVTVPSGVPFGPETVLAQGGSSATTAPLYVSDPWSQLLAGPSHTGSDSTNEVFNQHLSVSPQTYLSKAWTFNTGAPLTGSAAVVGGVAYVGDARGDVDAISVGSGTQLWTETVHGGGVASTVAVDAGMVFVVTEGGSVDELDAATGSPGWTVKLQAGTALSSPAVVGGSIFVASASGTVYALRESSGSVEWDEPLPGATTSAPAVDPDAGTLVIGDSTGTVTAFDTATGATRWTHVTGGAVTAAPMIVGETVYVGSQNGDAYALSEATGDVQWTTVTDAPISAAPVLAAGAPSIGFGSRAATYYLNPRDGAVVYRVAMTAPITGLGGAIGFVVTVQSDGEIVGSKPQATDPYAWQVKLSGTFDSAPTVVNDAVYVTGKNGMVTCYAIPGLPAY